MEASILIVSRNRKKELQKTLAILLPFLNLQKHEVRVYLDGETPGIEEVIGVFPEVIWDGSSVSTGASKARNSLYKKAKGNYLFGFDDDAHPLEADFIKRTIKIFKKNPRTGIIAFREIKNFNNNEEIQKAKNNSEKDYLTNDFMGCGFAVKKNVYIQTRGFPVWIDIYGEENCLALEALRLGYDILYTYQISVNHRVDKVDRKNSGGNYFRFEKQLKNTSYFYLVYYPFPLVLRKLVKLYFHNFKRYAMKDKYFFKGFLKALGQVLINSKEVLSYREPVKIGLLNRIQKLRKPEYHYNSSSE